MIMEKNKCPKCNKKIEVVNGEIYCKHCNYVHSGEKSAYFVEFS